MSIDWLRGYSSRWTLRRVNQRTWADGGEVAGVTSATVSRTLDGDAPTIDSASITATRSAGDLLEEGWYRLTMLATQGRTVERVDVATLWCAQTDGSLDLGANSIDITGRSVLWPCRRRSMPPGSYAPAGVDGARWAADVLAAATPAPVKLDISAGFTLDDAIVYDSTSALAAAWEVLRAGSHTLRVLGDGTIVVAPRANAPSLVLDRITSRLLLPDVGRGYDLSDVPNRYVAALNGVEAVAMNEDPASQVSTVRRGMIIDPEDGVDESPKRVNGETLDAYASRRLEELSIVTDERTYSREWWPNTLPGDLVHGTVASTGVDGDLRIVSQQLTCGAGILVEEKASREVRLWKMTS